MAQIVEAGGLPLNLGVAPDRLDAIAERIARGMEADVLVSSAGVSVGELDLVREALVNAGAELHLWKVDMRPGKPITFGSLAGKPVFGLPGNPVSAMVTFSCSFARCCWPCRVGGAQPAPREGDGPDAHRQQGSRRGYLRVVSKPGWAVGRPAHRRPGVGDPPLHGGGRWVGRFAGRFERVVKGQEIEVIILREVRT